MIHTKLNIDYLKQKEPKYFLFKTLLQTQFETIKGKNIIDLGAGHCIYSNISAELGANVTAVDARTIRLPKDLNKNITFIKEDVNKLKASLFKDFDLSLCFGLLYHLDIKEQIKLLKKLSLSNETWIDTHCTNPNDKLITDSGYTGTLYKEAENKEQMMLNPKASATTLKSFWHTKESLLKMFESIGSWKEVIEITPEHYSNRTFWLLKK